MLYIAKLDITLAICSSESTKVKGCKADDGEIRNHMNTFFNIVDKLDEFDVDINQDLRFVVVLYSAIDSRDELKLIDDSDVRQNKTEWRKSSVRRAWGKGKPMAEF